MNAIKCLESLSFIAWQWIKLCAFNVIMSARERSVICIRFIFEWLHLTFGRRHRMANELPTQSTETWMQRVLALIRNEETYIQRVRAQSKNESMSMQMIYSAIKLPSFCSNVGSIICILLNYVWWIAKMCIFICGLRSIFMPHLDLNKPMHTVYEYSQREIKSAKGDAAGTTFEVGDFVVMNSYPAAANAFIKNVIVKTKGAYSISCFVSMDWDYEEQSYDVQYVDETGSKQTSPVSESELRCDERVITHQQDDRSVLMYQKSGLKYHSLESITPSMLDAEIIHFDWQHYHDLSEKISDIESWHAMAQRGELKLYFEHEPGRNNLTGSCQINTWLHMHSYPIFKQPEFIKHCLDLKNEPASLQNRMDLSFCHAFLESMLWTDESQAVNGDCQMLPRAVKEAWNVQNVEKTVLSPSNCDFESIMDDGFKLPEDWFSFPRSVPYVILSRTIWGIFGKITGEPINFKELNLSLWGSEGLSDSIGKLLKKDQLVALSTTECKALNILHNIFKEGIDFYEDINKAVIGVFSPSKAHVVYVTKDHGHPELGKWMIVDNDRVHFSDEDLRKFAATYASWSGATLKDANDFYVQSLELKRSK